MDSDEYEGTAGSDMDDLINIECDMDDMLDMEDIDPSLLISDEDTEIVGDSSTKINSSKDRKTDKKPEPKTNDKKHSDETTDERKKSDSKKSDEKKKPEPKSAEKKKTEPNSAEKKPEAKPDAQVDMKKKPELKADEKQKPDTNQQSMSSDNKASESKVNDNKESDPKLEIENKQVATTSTKKERETKTNAEPVIISDDKAGNVSDADSTRTIEADVDDFPEEWMVIDEMEDDSRNKRKDSAGRSRTCASKSERDSKYSSRYSDSSRNRSRRGNRSRSRSTGRSRDDSRRSKGSEKEKETSSTKTTESRDRSKSSTTGSSKPSTTSSSKPSTTGSSKPSTTSSSKPSTTSSSKPSTTGSSKPSTTSSSKPSTTGSSKPSTTSSSKPSVKEKAKVIEKTADNKGKSTPVKVDETQKKPDDKDAKTVKTTETPSKDAQTDMKKQEELHKPVSVDPFKNIRDTIDRFDKNWRWNLKISPVELSDLNSEIFRQIISLANDSVLVFNMQKDRKRKYGFLDLCLTTAGEIRQTIDKLCQLKMDTNFIEVSISHKMFDKTTGTESALLKLDLTEGKNITSQPTKGTEKQRKINISNGPKGMSKIMLDAIFAKIAKIEITENAQNDTSSATVMCANPDSVGGILRFYQSVVIGGRRLQIRSEVPPPPPPKDTTKVERKSPVVAPANKSKSQSSQSNSSRQNDRDRNKRYSENRRRPDSSSRSDPVGNNGLLGPIPGGSNGAVFSTAMGSGRGFENDLEQRHRAILAREEVERRQESMQRLGLTVGVETFMDRPGMLENPDILRHETHRLQRELSDSQQLYENNLRQDMLRQEELRLHREAELRHQAEFLDHKRQQEDLLLRIQQEREQQIQEKNRLEQECLDRERLERERLERERLEAEKIERERLKRKEQECLEREHLERERLEKERKDREERERKERLAREQMAREKERQDELKRQEEMRRKERDNKYLQEQQQRDRYSDRHHHSNNPWQSTLHLQNEQDQFEKEIGLGNRNKQSRFDPPPTEEKKNLHQKIREQWEKQVADAKKIGQPMQHGLRRGDNNSGKQQESLDRGSEWNRSGQLSGNGRSYGDHWDNPEQEEVGYGSWSPASKGAGLLGPIPNQPQPSGYGAAVREYGHQSVKRGNPWGEETPNYGEKRSRNQEEVYGVGNERDASLMDIRPNNDQWNHPEAREDERNYNQDSWGTPDPYRTRQDPSYHQSW